MALTPLTRVQQATVLALVEARRLDAVPADRARATSFLRQAQERLDQHLCPDCGWWPKGDDAHPATCPVAEAVA